VFVDAFVEVKEEHAMTITPGWRLIAGFMLSSLGPHSSSSTAIRTRVECSPATRPKRQGIVGFALTSCGFLPGYEWKSPSRHGIVVDRQRFVNQIFEASA